MSETIGERIKRLRMEQGLSQRQLACPGVTYAYISRIEAGTRQPSVRALRKLAAKLGVTADYLETGYNLVGELAYLVEKMSADYLSMNPDDDDTKQRVRKAIRKIDENERHKTGII